MEYIEKMLDEIFKLMGRNHITRNKLSKECDIARQTVEKALKGEGQVKNLVKILKYLRKKDI